MIEALPINKFYEYVQAINVLTSEETLNDFTPHSFIHLKREKRQKLVNDLKRFIMESVDKGRGQVKGYGEILENIRRRLGRG